MGKLYIKYVVSAITLISFSRLEQYEVEEDEKMFNLMLTSLPEERHEILCYLNFKHVTTKANFIV